jgi:tRNA dimethylallyltransferase
MQIYKEMNIGTAKPTPTEMATVRHHLVDFLSPSENYNAESYKADALRAVKDITERGKIPLFVGGTGLYLDTLCARGENLSPQSDREYIEARASEIKTPEDVHALWLRLYEIDPESAAATHENNVKRVLRALEIYEKSGFTKTHFDRESRKRAPEINIGIITLDFHDRELLYKRVNDRVDQMMREGLLDEVKALAAKGLFETDSTAAQAIGYKELGEYLRNEVTLQDAIEHLKLSTRRYAKRQLTWFRHNEGAYRLYVDDESGKMRECDELLDEAMRAIDLFDANINNI